MDASQQVKRREVVSLIGAALGAGAVGAGALTGLGFFCYSENQNVRREALARTGEGYRTAAAELTTAVRQHYFDYPDCCDLKKKPSGVEDALVCAGKALACYDSALRVSNPHAGGALIINVDGAFGDRGGTLRPEDVRDLPEYHAARRLCHNVRRDLSRALAIDRATLQQIQAGGVLDKDPAAIRWLGSIIPNLMQLERAIAEGNLQIVYGQVIRVSGHPGWHQVQELAAGSGLFEQTRALIKGLSEHFALKARSVVF